MADSRFFDNRGPFTLADICLAAGVELPAGVNGAQVAEDVAGLDSAGTRHLTYCVGKVGARAFARSHAGACFVESDAILPVPAAAITLIPCRSPQHAFAVAARLFYPQWDMPEWSAGVQIDPSARVEKNVILAAGVAIGADAEIGSGTRISPNASIGPGVAIGRNCNIGSNVSIMCALVGDEVAILPGAQIGQPGFGFASGASGHMKIPQLGRVIIQDRVEIGAATTIDRGALGDTVIGEGTKIDNLVQIGHNTHIGRHCVIVAQTGISGSCEIGDFVVLGGQAGVADHAKIGTGARLAARCAAAPGELAGGQDYGGVPARPIKQWARELAAVSQLARRRKQTPNG
ncbi:MAG: UDP-3-O-(3-hydroxymyristoyl)glucosamine N-acyltransferase [Rhizomicrobium sp.]|jgi:UDP-3-O-[3-hydroxymyristoyl] glucosamine N-acyltransferase